MRTILLTFLLIVGCLGCARFATAAPTPQDQPHNVQFVNYNNDQELEEIQRQIIAQFDHLGGTSQFHAIEGASYVDPSNIKINV